MPGSSIQEIMIGEWAFHEIKLEDMELFHRYIRQTQYPASLWSSNFPYIWAESQSKQRKIVWRIIDGMLAPFTLSYKNSLYLFCLPFGKGTPEQVGHVLDTCMDYCFAWNGHDKDKTMLRMINDAQRDYLEQIPGFREKYRLSTLQGIERHYSVPDVAELHGKKFANIRNRVNKFRSDNPDAKITEYRDSDYDELIELAEHWKNTAGIKHDRVFDGVYYKEILKNSIALTQITLVIRVGSKAVGMISGGELPTGQAWGSITKFEDKIPGLSETLIVEYIKEMHHRNPAIELMNVGSDLGAGGLREYKLKFRPVLNYKRYQVYLK